MTGSAPLLVLLPGMLCDCRLFEPVLALLPPRETIVPSIDGAATVAELAAHLLDSLPPRFILGGFSLGGMIAQEMALQAPERVDRLCLIGTTAAPEPDGMAARRGAWVTQARVSGLAAFVETKLWPRYVIEEHLDHAALKDLVVAMAREAGIDAYAHQSGLLATSPDHRAALSTLRMRTLLLCGEGDRLCPPAEHRGMAAAIPGSTLHVIDRAGHFVAIEQPVAVAAAMRTWLTA